MKRILPLRIKAIIKSSCSMYYRMAIIETLPNYRSWLSVNLKGFIETNGDAKYGELSEEYLPSHFHSVFLINEVLQSSIEEKAITEYLVSSINEGKYVILYLDYNELLDSGSARIDNWYHETLIYGYDYERKVFFSPILNKNIFAEREIPFAKIETAYSSSKQYFKENPEYSLSRNKWYHLITEIKPKELVTPPNVLFEYLLGLERELKGGLVEKYVFSDGEETLGRTKFKDNNFAHEKGCFYGIAMVLHVSMMLKNYATSEKDPSSIRCAFAIKSVRFLLERVTILYEGMLWFVEYRKIKNNDEIETILQAYRELIQLSKRNTLLMEKFIIKGNFGIFIKVSDTVERCYFLEKDILMRFTEIVRNECISKYRCDDELS